MCNMFRFLLISVYFLGAYSQNSKSCLEYQLGPPLNFECSIDPTQVITLTWSPPENYETCDVQYLLHLRNVNTSEYLTDVQQTSNLKFIFPYENHKCIEFESLIFANYEGLTSTSSYTRIFLDPLSELGAPTQLLLKNSKEALKLEWTQPEGYEPCRSSFIYDLEFHHIELNRTIFSDRMIKYTLNYTFTYSNWSTEYYCDEVAIKLFGYFRGGQKTKMIMKTVDYGPAGYCQK